MRMGFALGVMLVLLAWGYGLARQAPGLGLGGHGVHAQRQQGFRGEVGVRRAGGARHAPSLPLRLALAICMS